MGIRAPKVIRVKRSAQRLHEAKLEAMVRREILRQGLQGLEIVSVDVKGGMKVGGGQIKLRIKRPRRMRAGRQLVRFFYPRGPGPGKWRNGDRCLATGSRWFADDV